MNEKELVNHYFAEIDKRKEKEDRIKAEEKEKQKEKEKRKNITKSIYLVVGGGMMLYFLYMLYDLFNAFLQ